jgi:hypothetical protein
VTARPPGRAHGVCLGVHFKSASNLWQSTAAAVSQTREKTLKMRIEGVLGRLMMTLGTVVAGFLPLLVDLSPTHVLNPAWPAHARLHEVWLLATGSLLGLVALYFIWLYREKPRFGIAMGAVLGSVLLGGFFAASATASLYGGVLVDPVTAPMMPNQDRIWGMPLNGFVFGLAWVFLLSGAALTTGGTRTSVSV